MSRSPRLAVAFFLAISAYVLLEAQGNPVTYVYDELGRLISVIAPNGDAAVYSYDAVGNLLSIVRQSAGAVGIHEFTPNGGAVGTAVKIYGIGFSTTPANNTVTFNGTSATVTASTANRLDVTVPTGATTGTIAVTTPAGSATSGTSFVVGSFGPTITSFTPTIGAAGTSVSVSGTNFDTVPSSNLVRFNARPFRPTVSAATATTLTVAVAIGGTSGHISVENPAGTGTSSGDFFVPPGSYTATDVVDTGRMTLGSNRSVTIGSSGKIGMVVFDATAGGRVSLKESSSSISLSGLDILKPDGSTLVHDAFGTPDHFLDPQSITTTGTYTIVVDPSSTYTGSVTLTSYDVPADTTGSVTLGGSAVSVSLSTPGQNGYLSFSGSANQRVSANATSNTFSTVRIKILDPSGNSLSSTLVSGSTGFVDVATLPIAGTYSVLVDPQDSATGSVLVTAYDVPADASGSITPGGSSVSISITTPGQNGALTFSGTANQRVSLNVTSNTISTSTVKILKPDGTTLTSRSMSGSGGFLDVETLPTTGTYSISIDPFTTSTGNQTHTLYNVPADVSGTLTVNGSAQSITISTMGQNASYTFSGTASQQATARVTSNTIGNMTVKILKPDGSTLTTKTAGSSSFNTTTQTLPTTGTYTVTVDPFNTNTGSLNLSVTSP